MSANPIGSSGQPRASAIGRSIAITRGVSWNDTKSPVMAGSPCAASRSLSTDPQVDAAGDQITGRGPFALLVPARRRGAGRLRRYDFDCTRANTHSPPTSASLSLKSWASRVSRSSFSGRHRQVGDDAIAGIAEVGDAFLASPPPSLASEQAAASSASASSASGQRERSRCGSPGHVPPERVQGGHHARLQRRGEVVLAGARPPAVLERSPGRRRCRAGRRRPPPRRSRWWPRPGPRARSSRRRGSSTWSATAPTAPAAE